MPQMVAQNVFSYTRLKVFQECPLRYYKRYVLGIPEPETERELFGKVVHAVIDRMVKGQALDRAIDEAIDETVGLDQAARFDRAEIERLVRVARVEGAQYGAGLSKRHFFLELEPLDPQSPILQGYIDFLDGDLRITDWATSWSVYHPTEDFKLALKALALAEIHGLERVEVRLVFLRAKKEERVQSHVYTRERWKKPGRGPFAWRNRRWSSSAPAQTKHTSRPTTAPTAKGARGRRRAERKWPSRYR
jgi:ATP-dependent nuclease, subunit B